MMAHSRTVSLYADKAIHIVYVIGTDLLINSDRYGLPCICPLVHIQKMCRSSSGVERSSVGLHCYSQAVFYSLRLKRFMIQFQLISEISVCIFVLNTGCTGMQTNVALVLDVICVCVCVLVLAALMVFCCLSCCQQGGTLLSKTNAYYISCQTPAYMESQSTDWDAVKSLWKKKSTTYDI